MTCYFTMLSLLQMLQAWHALETTSFKLWNPVLTEISEEKNSKEVAFLISVDNYRSHFPSHGLYHTEMTMFKCKLAKYHWVVVSNSNRSEWSPIRSVTIWMITKSNDRPVGVRFVYHEYDGKPKSHYQLIMKVTISEKRRVAKLWKKGRIGIKRRAKEA